LISGWTMVMLGVAIGKLVDQGSEANA